MLAVLFCIYEKDHSLYEEIITGRFKRDGKNHKGEVRNISLNNFLKQSIQGVQQLAEIKYFIEPLSYTNSFYLGQMTSRNNNFATGNYSIKLTEFIDSIFCRVFNNTTNSVTLMFSSSSENVTALHSAEQKLSKC